MEETTSEAQRLSKTLARLKKVAEVYQTEYNMEKRDVMYELVQKLAADMGIT